MIFPPTVSLTRPLTALTSGPTNPVDTAVQTVRAAADAPRRVRGLASAVLHAGASAVGEVLSGRPLRRISTHGDDRWIEVRGLTAQFDVLEPLLRTGFEALPGVTGVHVNGPLSRVMVTVSADGPSNDDLTRVIETAEGALDDASTAVRGEPLPGDDAQLAANLLAVAVTGLAAGAAVAGSLLPIGRLSRAAAVPITVADYHPALRSMLDRRLGVVGADLLIRSASGTVAALSGSPAAALVNTSTSTLTAADTLIARATWTAAAGRLCDEARAVDSVPATAGARAANAGREGREGYEEKSIDAGLAGAAVVALTGTARQSAEAALVGAPKATRAVRESFGTALDRGLAARHDVVLRNPRALRSLSRIDTLLVDPRALFTDELAVNLVRGTAPEERTQAWHSATAALAAGRLQSGWNPLPEGGEALVGPVRQPLASAVLMEARRAGLTVVSLSDDGLGSLQHAFDELLAPAVDPDSALAAAADQLTQTGHTVALLSRTGVTAAPHTALTVALLDDTTPTSWNADVLACDLKTVWRIMHAVPAAAEARRRGHSLSAAGSLLGALMLIPGVPGDGPGSVNSAALYGVWTGFRLARRMLADPLPAPEATRDWHALPVSEVVRLLPPPEHDHAPEAHVAIELARRWLSALDGPRRYLHDFAATMREDLADPITPVLATGAAASALLGSPLDAAMVGGVLALNTALSAQQSLHAERLLRRLLARQEPLARRVNAVGDDVEIGADSLLPGDLIEVRSGEVVPADARIIDADNVEVDESSLTGESLPVAKNTADTPGAPLAERTGMLFAGTTMVAGKAHALVTAVGDETAASRALAMSPRASRSVGLAAQLGEITRRALPWSFTGGALIGAISLLRGTPLRETASGTVAIAVAAVPEGLPLVVTLAQSASARRLTGSSVLVRNPLAVEAFARLDAVCFDKTGTLSENRLRVAEVIAVGDASDDDVLRAAGETMLVRRDGSLEHPTDAAVHEAAQDAGLDFVKPDALLPFQSERPFAAALVGRQVMVKGAPDALAGAIGDAQQAELHVAVDAMAARGLRVLAVAERTVTARQAATAAGDPDRLAALASSSLRLVGLVGMSDTPRPGSRPLIENLTERGIEVRIITGDHPVTAAAIATGLGLPTDPDDVMTGDRWNALTTSGRTEATARHRVYARMSPEHKVQVVQALEDAGLVTAMVGDGANDAAAIRAASVGIGVASEGGDPARIAADVMLLDGDVYAIVDALEEGEQLWRRVLSSISVLIGHSVGEVTFGLLTTVLTGRPALSARQMMLVNMLTDALPAAALAVSPQLDPDVDGAHDQSTIWRAVAVRAVFTTLGAQLGWTMARLTGRRQRAATVGLVGLVGAQMLEMLMDSHGPLVIATSVGTFLVMGTIITIPGLSHLFGCTPLGPVGWAQGMGAALAAAAISKWLPGVVDKLADELPRLLATVEDELPAQVRALLVDDEDAGADQDAVDVLDDRRDDADAGVHQGVGSEAANEVCHES
ncbi:MAG: cation-translocating P-type ATPase [Gordonia sp. (in: high G+C Gram-positive bacteria)]